MLIGPSFLSFSLLPCPVTGVHLINLGSTWEKLMLAARIIVAVENPADVVVVSGRPYGQRACYKFGQYTGSNFLSGRFTPGTFTNQVNKKFLEPRVIIVTDPRTDYQVRSVLHEIICSREFAARPSYSRPH